MIEIRHVLLNIGFKFVFMHFQVARLQEIVTKIQYNCKLNFKNAVDVAVLLEADGFDLLDLNNLVSAGVKLLGFKQITQFREVEDALLKVKSRYIGDLSSENLEEILEKFSFIESVVSVEMAEKISHLNALKGKVTEILVRVNVLNEENKYGFLPAELMEKVNEIGKLSGLKVRGISSYVPAFSSDNRNKKALRKLKVLFELMKQKFRGVEVFSLNIQANIADLIAEGVTEIRVDQKSLIN